MCEESLQGQAWRWHYRAIPGTTPQMDALSLFGLAAVSFTLLCYAKEAGSHWWTLGFAFGCVLGSIYGFLQGAWPFGVVELIWTVVSFRRWLKMRQASSLHAEPLA